MFTLKKMKEDQRIASFSLQGKKPINSINHNGNIQIKHIIIKSNSFTNNKLPLLTIQDKKLNSVSSISFRDSIKEHIKINNNKLIKKKKQDYLGCNRMNFELMRMSNAIKYMLNSNKKQNNILKTVKSRKFNLKGNTGNENKNKGSIDTSIKPRSNNNSNHPKPIIFNNKNKIDTETEEDSFDIPEDEQIKAEILFDSPPISINYPRIIKNPPGIFNYIISPTEQYIAKKYKNYNTIQDRMLCNKNYKHTALQTEPLGIIKEEDEQSDLTKTHSSLNKRSILLESKNYPYLIDNDKHYSD